MKFKFDWGAGVVAIIVGIVLFTSTLVLIATRQNFALVDKDYYERGVTYDQQIDKVENTNALIEKISFRQENNQLVVVFPPEIGKKKVQGSIHFYSPANKSNDFLTAIKTDANFHQAINTERLVKGRYVIKVDWKTGSKSYYQEETINIR